MAKSNTSKKRKQVEATLELGTPKSNKLLTKHLNQSSIESYMSPKPAKKSTKTPVQLVNESSKSSEKKGNKRKASESSLTTVGSENASQEAPKSSPGKKRKASGSMMSQDDSTFGDSDFEAEVDVRRETLDAAKSAAPWKQRSADDGSGWAEQETMELVACIKNIPNVKPTESVSFRRRLPAVLLDDVATVMAEYGRSVEECKDRLTTILNEVSGTRNLHQMLSCYTYNYPSKKKPSKNALKLFIEKNIDMLKEKYPQNVLIGASTMFKALSDEEKQPYIDASQALRGTVKPLNSRKVYSPAYFYGEKHTPGLEVKALAEKFNALPINNKKKLNALRKSLNSYKLALNEFQELKKTFPTGLVKTPKDHILKAEYRAWFKHLGMPSIEVETVFQLYNKECPSEDPAPALQRYKTFANSEHFEKYKAKFQKLQQNYLSAFEEWINGETQLDFLLKEKAKELHAEVLRHPTEAKAVKVKTAAPKQVKPPKPVKQVKPPKAVKQVTIPQLIRNKLKGLEDTMVDAPKYAASHFPSEPRPKGLTAKECFFAFTKNVTPVGDSKWDFTTLSESHKKQLVGVAANNVKEYQKAVKTFVSELPADMRKIYIGHNRVKFVRAFEGVDVFEDDYPVEDYPTYRPAKKTARPSLGNEKAEKTLLEIMAEVNGQEEPLASSTPFVPMGKTKDGIQKEGSYQDDRSDASSNEDEPEERSEDSDSGHEEIDSEEEQEESIDDEMVVKTKSEQHQNFVTLGSKKQQKVLLKSDQEGSSSSESEDEHSSDSSVNQPIVADKSKSPKKSPASASKLSNSKANKSSPLRSPVKKSPVKRPVPQEDSSDESSDDEEPVPAPKKSKNRRITEESNSDEESDQDILGLGRY